MSTYSSGKEVNTLPPLATVGFRSTRAASRPLPPEALPETHLPDRTRISKTHPLPMSAHPLAGKPAPKDLLIDVNKFEEAFYASKPDPTDPNQLVSFGTSGGRLFTIDLALESALSRVVLEQ